MNDQITTMPTAASPVSLRTILSQEGVRSHLVDLHPGEQLPLEPDSERLLFVLQGELTCTRGAVNTIVNTHEAILAPANNGTTLSARNEETARFLVVELPARAPEPEIRTFDR